jgi:hypothetical protein
MEATVRDVIGRGWSVEPGNPRSFEEILAALWRIRLKMTPVGTAKMFEFADLVDRSAAVKPAMEFPPPSLKKGMYFGAPNGIIGHLTMECHWDVHDDQIAEVTSGRSRRRLAGPIHTRRIR